MKEYKTYIPVALIILMFLSLIIFHKDIATYISQSKIEQLSANTKKSISDSIAQKYNYHHNGETYDYTFIEFGSTGCHSCRQMEEVMEKIKTEYKGKVNVVFINLMEPESKRFFEYYGVATIPTQILLDRKGKEFFRHTGFYSADELSTHFTMKKGSREK